jgi:hypothetical protein
MFNVQRCDSEYCGACCVQTETCSCSTNLNLESYTHRYSFKFGWNLTACTLILGILREKTPSTSVAAASLLFCILRLLSRLSAHGSTEPNFYTYVHTIRGLPNSSELLFMTMGLTSSIRVHVKTRPAITSLMTAMNVSSSWWLRCKLCIQRFKRPLSLDASRTSF